MFDLRRSVLAEASDVSTPVPEQMIRSQLGAFLFSGDDVFKPVSVLSGGEKSRLALAKLLLDPPNFLVMDEPTTHLDMRSIEALIAALGHYTGTLAFVSHDVHFIRSMATSVLHVRPGEVRFYPGGYDYFIDKTAADADQSSNDNAAVSSPKSQTNSPNQEKDRKRLEAEARQQRTKNERELRSKLQDVEKRILELERRQQELVAALQESTGSTSGQSLELKQIADKLGDLMPEWERLVEAMKLVRPPLRFPREKRQTRPFHGGIVRTAPGGEPLCRVAHKSIGMQPGELPETTQGGVWPPRWGDMVC